MTAVTRSWRLSGRSCLACLLIRLTIMLAVARVPGGTGPDRSLFAVIRLTGFRLGLHAS